MAMKWERAKRGRRAGFTLVELMVVIAIIGILAALVLPEFMQYLDDAKVNSAKAQIKLFETALQQYKIKIGKYPTTGEGLNVLVNPPGGQRPFLNSSTVPNDPWGTPYAYVSPGTHNHPYEITSYGEDGVAGGTEYAADIVSWDLSGQGQK